MRLKQLFSLLLMTGVLVAMAQEEEAPTEDGATVEEEDDDKEEEECEEAWEYLEFLKKDIKSSIENIMQDTLFQPQAILETTVANTMDQVLEIRAAVLDRVKKIRTGDESITICPGQGINQEEFLTELRMSIMDVLLGLIEPDAATPDKLKELGRKLLNIRTNVNGKITQLIMLRESRGPPPPTGDCDCSIYSDLVKNLDDVIATGKDKPEDDEDAEGDAAEEAPAEEGGEDDMNPVAMLTMILMNVDSRIEVLYNEILAQADAEKRTELGQEHSNLKGIATNLDQILYELLGETNEPKIKRLLSRDVVSLRNAVDAKLQECRQACPTECDSCGADKIDELLNKLQDYNVTISTLDEDDAKESVRSDLMNYLASVNTEMTKLLTSKVESENGTLEVCDAEVLEVINSVKGPLWMLVNITIYGDAATMNEMVTALEAALMEMRTKYCAPGSAPTTPAPEDNQCDLEEIEVSGEWIGQIDTIISDNLFKPSDDGSGRTDAMLGFIELKATMEDRVRQLFLENLVCKEEVEQIKNIYSDQLTKCLSEMMNPKYRFELKSRAERVQCIKSLRVTIEDRRGELLMREIEKRIKENFVEGGEGEEEEAESA